MYLDVFSKRLRALRLSRGFTLQNVGDVVGSNRHSIGNMENSRASPSLAMAIALADLFDVSVDYLIGRTDNPARIPAGDGEPVETVTEQSLERQKMVGMIESLHKENAEKALSYITFLRLIQRREDRKKKRLTEEFIGESGESISK